MTTQPGRLEISGLRKSFGQRQALDDVTLHVEAGTVHALVGQNGSGKSTIVKILAGRYAPDGYQHAFVDGVTIPLPPRPRQLLQAGITFVHQDVGVLDGLTVLENMSIGRFVARRVSRRIDWRRQEERAEAVLCQLGLSISPHDVVEDMTRDKRTLVAIGRALMAQSPGGGLMVLDEATRALPPDSCEQIHTVIRAIAAAGGSILLISHNLTEVLSVADAVTVLRDGHVVAAQAVAGTSEAKIAKLMLGRDLPQPVRRRTERGASRIVIRGLSGRTAKGVDLDLEGGETVGITGRPGCGYDEIPYLLSGASRASAGTLDIDGDLCQMSSATVTAMLRRGVVLVPEDRIRQGLASEMSIADNITLPRLRRRGHRAFVGSTWRATETAEAIAALDVRPPDGAHLVQALSGGNQQKVLLGKWFAHQPRLLVLHEPTQAVDIGARADILEVLRSEAGRGTAILVASTDPTELASLCSSVLVIEDGRVARSLVSAGPEQIVDAIYLPAPSMAPGTARMP